ncbi:hypothetical protein I6A84_31470 [Frankia sp. CNm7]|uniref:Uncharacterized protein n=1 Tax=Frankia nepalensis TaxID=1836974 RepID=A0A937UP06_9ACTN|nr:hypothetical protein [Frankia nepalensis]MBL7497093.1 hypothetical protein [Frankia nepalensis]MBL7510765.1 hypothetical protein [Frankia nepalensis]MBL7522483.1 hypothetical protein [Frankia nepalensis]MBL7626775.1 hypothetical protein [Frankia nepalensis]
MEHQPPPSGHARELEYRRRQRRAAQLAFADMVADAERLGLYDIRPDTRTAPRAVRKQTEA